jgi:DNA mismatch repair protein MutS
MDAVQPPAPDESPDTPAPRAEPPRPDAPRAETRVTPMMEQYIEIKAANPDCLLFYRMGDFYEMFFADAETASRALGIVLTKRGKHQGADIPMCGVPIERADEYLHRLIALGHRVAVCEQLEDPAEAKKRGGKSVVRRDVVRLVTPGTLTEETLLDSRRNNFLAAIVKAKPSSEHDDGRFALACLDISTGEFRLTECDRVRLAAEIARVEPGEVIVADTLYEDPDVAPFLRTLPAVTPLGRDVFDGATAERRVAAYFAVATADAFGSFSRLELTAAAACVTYVERTQLGRRPPLSPPTREASGATLLIDAGTRANLELMKTLGGERRGSLLAAIDRTVTAAGSRLLAQRIAAPLTDPAAIARRLDAVDAFVADGVLRSLVRDELAAAPDLARALARLVLGRGGPRDLAAIRDGLAAAVDLAARLDVAAMPDEIAAAIADLRAPDPALGRELAAALADELPLLKRDGGFVRDGYDATLDETRALRDESRRVIAALQARYADETGIRTLKIRHNNVLGYFVEVTAQHGDKLMAPPFNETFVHRQTLAGQVRFTSVELGALEARIASAADRALGLELDTFERLSAAVVDAADAVKAAAQALAVIDVAAALAEVAVACRFVRPEVDASLAFRIEGGRHPVVEQALVADGSPFVANDCDLSPAGRQGAEGGAGTTGPGRIAVVTGPNMAGKSTYLRQNALIVVLAQAGSFVPAARAHVGVVDRLFSRVGAADDLARGRSTFMVEMVETAAILNQAGERSLVILDEIGRGTATFDGLSIAWAAIEHLHDRNRCRALFATHFHELTALAKKLARLFNITVRVKEWHGEVVFLHEVVAGAADRSYGIQVAKLAGLPPAVIERAKHVLGVLEAEDRTSPARKLVDDLPLFAARPAPPPPPADPHAEAVMQALAGLDPDALSPREALEALYALKQAARR